MWTALLAKREQESAYKLKRPTGERIEYAIQLGFLLSDNETEYEAILARVELAKSVSSEKLTIHSHSQLVVGQANREYETRDQHMIKWSNLVMQQLGSFSTWKLKHIPRDLNVKAYALESVAASIQIKETMFLPVYYQPASSITTNQVS